eukprot:73055-Rhodomonas_salina.1
MRRHPPFSVPEVPLASVRPCTLTCAPAMCMCRCPCSQSKIVAALPSALSSERSFEMVRLHASVYLPGPKKILAPGGACSMPAFTSSCGVI